MSKHGILVTAFVKLHFIEDKQRSVKEIEIAARELQE
jgi:hypothetical protein